MTEYHKGLKGYDNPMSDEEYEAIKASSEAIHISGVVRRYWRGMRCGSTHYSVSALALSCDDGGSFSLGHDSVYLPEGTRVTIDIPAGARRPPNRFCPWPIKIRKGCELRWCDEFKKPEPYDDDYEEE